MRMIEPDKQRQENWIGKDLNAMEKGELRSEVTQESMMETIRYMTEHFPYRLAGSPCEAAAAEYVANRMEEYGLEVDNETFYTYNSDPMYSKVQILQPEFLEIDSLPCAHIRGTKPEGEEFDLIYVGDGSYGA